MPREKAGQRGPLRVTPGAFTAAGLPVPEDPRQRNCYQLTGRQGYEWSPAIDAHVRGRGAELLGGDAFLCIDVDTALAVDGSVWLDGMRRLADLAAESGNVPDLAGCVAVRTPGHGTHGPGWHLWWRADPARPVRLGALDRCPLIEVKNRCTAPGSPGYTVRSVPDGDLSVLPSWLADLAGPPRPAVTGRPGRAGGTRERLEGVLEWAAHKQTRQARPYTDTTVSWSKSLSVFSGSQRISAAQAREAGGDQAAAAYWDSELADYQQILRDANQAMLDYAERWAGFTRTGYHGAKVNGTETGRWASVGPVISSWLQGTSRDGDPQDHTHNLWARMVRTDGDGRWRALDTVALRQLLPAMQAVAVAYAESARSRGSPFDRHRGKPPVVHRDR